MRAISLVDEFRVGSRPSYEHGDFRIYIEGDDDRGI